MCTAISTGGYFGRTLDLEYCYNETVTVTPRSFDFGFDGDKAFALIGMATVMENYPLYYDALNEKGLCMAGLNFPKSARYFKEQNGKINVATFEFIPFVLRQCESVLEARELIIKINLTPRSFSPQLPAATLHWMLADKESCIVVESCADGLHVYDNETCVMTNEPPFPQQLENLRKFSHLSPYEPQGEKPDSRGTGALGLPGDYSSRSRFVKAAFLAKHSQSDTEQNEVAQFFHVIGGVEMPMGAVRLDNGQNDISQYTSCMDMRRGIYYYKTYGNSRVCGVDMCHENLSSDRLITYPLKTRQDIFWENRG